MSPPLDEELLEVAGPDQFGGELLELAGAPNAGLEQLGDPSTGGNGEGGRGAAPSKRVTTPSVS